MNGKKVVFIDESSPYPPKELFFQDRGMSILPGHLDIDQFVRTFMALGGIPAPLDEDDLSHEYWIRKDHSWVCSHKDDPKAEAVTVVNW